jgi:1-aminocyclopropane-1-carboxylate deaminase/D-cysteine desulfhydrase-like pyridoxal-dependent ACC family enzyme
MSQLVRDRMSIEELRKKVSRLPRVALGHFPTPLEPLPRFSRQLEGPPVLIKRDDCTGLALGGNKTRHNEFILGQAVEQGAEIVVWGAGVQSNNCRQTAAACAKLGMKCHLILSRADHTDEVQGNLLLDHLLGATVEIVDPPMGPELFQMITDHAQKLRRQGHQVYNWDNDVCKPRATISYALCFAEIVEQLAEQGLEPAAIYICSAGSTGAGLVLGKALLGHDVPLRIIQPIRWPWDVAADLAKTANTAARLLDLAPGITAEEIDVTEAYIGPGYGKLSEAGMEAIRLLARTEGILLDPVYTSKVLAAVMDDIRSGRVSGDRPLVFVHTGGTPALFAYRDELMQRL